VKDLGWSWLGRRPYRETLEAQRKRRDAVIDGVAPETLWLLEHDPVVTTGRRRVPDLMTPEELAARGVDFHKTERGGLATYHGPGQLVAYAIVDCWGRGIGARGAVHAMEQGVIDWLREMGLPADRRNGFPGVWIGRDKICAVGMHFKKGVSMHGLGLNLTESLDGFDLITPCGITDGGVVSLAKLTGRAVSPEDAAQHLGPHLIRNFLNPACTLNKPSCDAG